MPLKSYGPWLGAKCGWWIIGSRRKWAARSLDLAGGTAKARFMCIAGLAAVPAFAQCITSFF